MSNTIYTIENQKGVPDNLQKFLEYKYQSMYVTLSYFRNLKQINKLQTLLLYKEGELCDAFVYEIVSKECILLNRVVSIASDRLDQFCQWIFIYLPRISKISYWDLTSPCVAQHSICYSRSSDTYIDLPDTLEQYDVMLGKKSRTQFKYYLKKVQREVLDVKILVNVGYECLEGAAFEEIVSLKEKRFDSKKQLNSFNVLKAKKYAQLAKDYGRITTISASGKIIASLLCYKVCDKYFFTLVAFDIDYAQYSLGRTVFYLAIQGAITEGAKECHFLWGGTDYVTHYGGKQHQLYTTHVFRSYNLYYLITCLRVRIKSLEIYFRKYPLFKNMINRCHSINYILRKHIANN